MHSWTPRGGVDRDEGAACSYALWYSGRVPAADTHTHTGLRAHAHSIISQSKTGERRACPKLSETPPKSEAQQDCKDLKKC